MNLNEQIQNDLKNAVFAKDELQVSTLRFLIADFKNYKIEKQRELTDEDFLMVVDRQAKRHRESIESFDKANRKDLADKERAELEIINKYLPAQISIDEIKIEVDKAISETGATAISDMGKVMAALSGLKGKADMGAVSQVVKEKLS